MKTLISVVIPAYNCAQYLQESLNSILTQTYKPIEVIVVNDGSTDNTDQILSSIKDSRLKVINNEKNSGIVYSLNAGIKEASSDYIARMDSDDIAHPMRIEEQIAYLIKNKHVAVLGTHFEFLSHNTVVKFPSEHNQIKSRLFYSNSLGHPTVMINRKIVGDDLAYKEQYKYAEDYELWNRLSHKYTIENLPLNLLKYRIHPNQISSSLQPTQNEIVTAIRLENINRLGIQLYDSSRLDGIFRDTFSLSNESAELARNIISANNKQNIYPQREFTSFIDNACGRMSEGIFLPKSYFKFHSKRMIKSILAKFGLFQP